MKKQRDVTTTQSLCRNYINVRKEVTVYTEESAQVQNMVHEHFM